MPKVIISDTSCFILLTNIGRLDLLNQIYGEIVTTMEIAAEYGEVLPDWVTIAPISDKYRQRLLEMQVDKGEASAIALAIETTDCTIILDDYKARRVANQLGLSVTGTIGVIIKAKMNGIIPSIKPLLSQIKKTNLGLPLKLREQHY